MSLNISCYMAQGFLNSQLTLQGNYNTEYPFVFPSGSSAFSDSGSAGRMSNGSIATKRYVFYLVNPHVISGCPLCMDFFLLLSRGAPGRIAQKGPPSQHSGPPRVMSHPQSRMRDLSAFPGEMVPKVAVEELEQEILARDETVQVMCFFHSWSFTRIRLSAHVFMP